MQMQIPSEAAVLDVTHDQVLSSRLSDRDRTVNMKTRFGLLLRHAREDLLSRLGRDEHELDDLEFQYARIAVEAYGQLRLAQAVAATSDRDTGDDVQRMVAVGRAMLDALGLDAAAAATTIVGRAFGAGSRE